MRDLQRLANERQLAEERIQRNYESAVANAKADFKQSATQADEQYGRAKAEQEQRHRERMDALNSAYDSQRHATQAEYRQVRDEVERKYETTVRETRDGKKQAMWQAMAVFDASKNNPREALEQVQAELAGLRQALDQLEFDAVELLRMRRIWNPEFTAQGG